MPNRRSYAILVTCLLSVQLFAQLSRNVDPRDRYYRVYAIVPFTGSGTASDPRLPKHAPVLGPPGAAASQMSRGGILGWAMVESDDGKSALVEFVAADHSALNEILEDPSVQSFEKGKFTQQQIQAAFQRYRKGFDFSRFGVRLP